MSLMWKLPPKYEPRAILSVICKWQEFYLLVSRVNRHLPAALASNCAFPGMKEKTGECSQSLGKLHIPYLGWLCSPNKNNMSKTCLSDLSIISQRLERNHTWGWAIRTFHGWPPSRTPNHSSAVTHCDSFPPQRRSILQLKNTEMRQQFFSLLTDSSVSWVDGKLLIWAEGESGASTWCWHMGKTASNYR